MVPGEARFGQKGTNSRVWAEHGTRPRAFRQHQYEWAYLFGAVCVDTGECNGWIAPVANTEVFNFQLESLSRQLAIDVHAVLVVDRAGWHMARGVVVPGNITVVPLPPYSPELNPCESIWKVLRQRYLSNRVFPDIEQLDVAYLDEAVGEAWCRFIAEPEAVVSLCRYHWMEPMIN